MERTRFVLFQSQGEVVKGMSIWRPTPRSLREQQRPVRTIFYTCGFKACHGSGTPQSPSQLNLCWHFVAYLEVDIEPSSQLPSLALTGSLPQSVALAASKLVENHRARALPALTNREKYYSWCPEVSILGEITCVENCWGGMPKTWAICFCISNIERLRFALCTTA